MALPEITSDHSHKNK